MVQLLRKGFRGSWGIERNQFAHPQRGTSESRGSAQAPPPGSFGTTFSAEYLDIAAAVAGHAIGSPILFRAELDAGRLVSVHDFAASDGRRFWFACPVARHGRRKIVQFREWLCDEATVARRAARPFLRELASGPA